jgi:hypothetical protein
MKKLIALLGLLATFPATALAAGDTILGNIGTSNTPPGLTDVAKFIDNVKNFALTAASLVCISLIVWGGVTMITSAGDPEKVKKARGILTAAIVGLLIVIISYAIVNYLAAGLKGQLGF